MHCDRNPNLTRSRRFPPSLGRRRRDAALALAASLAESRAGPPGPAGGGAGRRGAADRRQHLRGRLRGELVWTSSRSPAQLSLPWHALPLRLRGFSHPAPSLLARAQMRPEEPYEDEDDEDFDLRDERQSSDAKPRRLSRISDLDGTGRVRLSSYTHKRVSYGGGVGGRPSKKMCAGVAWPSDRSLPQRGEEMPRVVRRLTGARLLDHDSAGARGTCP